ncbi:MAG: hypothetical protein WCX65_05105 [bacterium]
MKVKAHPHRAAEQVVRLWPDVLETLWHFNWNVRRCLVGILPVIGEDGTILLRVAPDDLDEVLDGLPEIFAAIYSIYKPTKNGALVSVQVTARGECDE